MKSISNSNFVNISFPLSVFDSDKKKAIELYLKLMHSDGQEETVADFEFFSKQLGQYKGPKIYLNIKFELPTCPSIQEIADSLKICPEDMVLLTSDSRKRNLTYI